MKFAHIADVHIKNLKYHDIYEDVFQQLYRRLEEEKVHKIIICGDIAHTKTNISPEFVQIAGRFFTELADIAPLYIILGNHDGNLKNLDRQDAITPIVEALNNPDIHLLKKSGEVHIDEKFALNVLSIFDRDNWTKPSNPDKINIALYHGAIEGSKTDTGWAMKDTDDSINIFDDFDFAFLGDIHKQQFLKWRVAYCGSLIQQNFGEETDKGLLIWDIQEKDVFRTKKIYFKNPSPFLTINYTGEDTYIPSNSFVRVVLDKFYSKDQVQEIKDKIQSQYNPRSIVVIDKHTQQVENTLEEGDKTKLNLRDNNVQQELIKEFLEGDNLPEDVLNQVLEINTKYNLEAEVADDVARNIKWKLESFEWDNLFNYKEGNKIDFSSLSGVVGIFGKNYSGKSSIIDGLLYTLFNSTSKKIRRNFDVVNERKKEGKGFACISVSENEILAITRETEKNIKKSKGKLVEEGKTELSFEILAGSSIMPFNGNDRTETDKNIRKEIGTLEDFCNTSLSTQHGSLDFINEGSTRRKEVLANFLDLQIFEKKHKPANQYANELKSLIKKLGGKDYEKILSDLRMKEAVASNDLESSRKIKESFAEKLEEKNAKLEQIEINISKVEESIDYDKLVAEEKKLLTDLELADKLIKDKTEELTNLQDNVVKINEVLAKLNIEDLKSKQESANKLTKQIENILNEKKTQQKSLSIYKKSSELLDMAACGKDLYKDCSFKKSALDSLEEIAVVEVAIKSLEDQEKTFNESLSSLGADKVAEYIDKHTKLKDKLNEATRKTLTLQTEIARSETTKLKAEKSLETISQTKAKYEENKELYDNIVSLIKERDLLQEQIIASKNNYYSLEKDYLKAISHQATIKQQIASAEEQASELEKLNKEYSAYELFLKAVHNNGIPFELIKRTLPVINEEMNKLLQNIVEFEAFFENEDGKLEIYIKHPNMSPRSIENCSGAEKSLVAMAIRLALVKCGSLPVSDVFILDEPATSLDAEHLDSFIKVLDMIKTQFKVVLLITHLDALKDSVDKIIEIQKDENGFAYIN